MYCGTLLFLLDLFPGGGGWGCATAALQVVRSLGRIPATIQVQGKCKKWCSLLPLVLDGYLSSQRALAICSLLHVVPLSSVCCIEAVQLALRRNCSKYRYKFNVFLEGGELNVLLHCHLRTASSVLF